MTTATATNTAERAGTQAWVTVGLLFLAACLNYADRTAISALFPLLQRELKMNDLALAALGSLFLWTYAIGSPFAGLLADRHSRSRIVIWSLAAWSVVTIWTGMARSATELLITRAVLGIAECAYLPAAIALIADYHPPSSRATALGMHLCGLNLGLVAGGGLAGYLGEQHGWRASFLVLGLLGLLLACVNWFVLRDGPARVGRAATPRIPLRLQLRRVLRIPSYLLVMAQAMLIAVGVWMFFNWMPLYFKESFGLSLAVAGLSGTAALQLSASLGMLAGGYFSDRVSRRGLPRRALLMGLSYCFAAPCLLVFAGSFDFGSVAAAVVLFSLGRALGGANEGAMICDLLPPLDRSTALGLMNTMNCFAGGVGIFVAGFLRSDFGLSGVFAGVSVLVLLAAALALLAYRVYLPRDLARRQELEA